MLTLVAFHGSKCRTLADLVVELQAAVRAATPAFEPYALGQVHATIVGLERTRGAAAGMDLPGWLAFLRTTDLLPATIRIGGFRADERPFASRGLGPYERSFSVQGDRVVLIGWPEQGGAFPDVLDRLRREALRHGIVHAYHRTPADRDNDLYLRLGLLRAPLPEDRRAALEQAVRERLAARAITRLALTRADLALIAYTDPALPLESSRAFALDDPRLGPDFLARLQAD